MIGKILVIAIPVILLIIVFSNSKKPPIHRKGRQPGKRPKTDPPKKYRSTIETP